ncbi:MAG: hypothetical protein J6J38_05420 [Lachnospiraceae bacterium]|nr:hypothetical protein [Lachnospiraceae bacterium]
MRLLFLRRKEATSGKRRILDNQQVELENLISFRGKVRQREIPLLIRQMVKCAEAQRAKVGENLISATYQVELVDGEKVAEVELMLPVEGKITDRGDFTCKPRFFLKDAVKMEYQGPSSGFATVFEEMKQYIEKKGYVPITVGYIVSVLNNKNEDEVDMEVYMGVSANVL